MVLRIRKDRTAHDGRSAPLPKPVFFVGIMTGTLEEKVERDVRAHPDDYSTAGKWLDDYSLSHGSRLKAKLLQKKKEFDKSGIQKEANKLKRKARTTGTKTAKEAAERFARSCQSRKDDLTKLKKEIRAFDAYLKTPKGEPPVAHSVLIREAWEYVCSENPQDIKKILLIFWLLTDRFIATTGPGLTLFEKWSYGDDRECAEPEEYFGTRHETLNEMISIDSKMIPTVEAAIRATARNKETEQKASGGKAEENQNQDYPAIDDKELTILVELAEISDKTSIQAEIEAATSIKRGTLKDKLQRLESIGLIHRPLGKRKGYQITDKGREIANRNQ